MKFIPENAGMSIEDIAEFLNEAAEQHDAFVEAHQIPAAIAQEFVNREYDLREEMIDEDEEDFVEARNQLCDEMFRKMVSYLS